MSSSFVKLAKAAAEEFVRHQSVVALPTALPAELTVQRACYVSLYGKPGRRLLAMYGEPLPRHTTVAEEIIAHTIVALTRRRGAVSRGDLPSVAYAVAVLGPPQRVPGAEHLNPARYALYLTSDRGAATVLLPQRAGVETAEDQVATAIREAGVNPHREAITLYRIEVVYYDE